MKKIIGIVAEYNPFHEGHRYHIERSREMADPEGEGSLVVCCMSGDFVQRGEWAILPKHERAAAAIKGGADLVAELPLPWCLSSAETFAEGAVSVLAGMGITHLSFGSECGDMKLLSAAAEAVSAPDFQNRVSAVMKKHPELTYPAARGTVLSETFFSGKVSSVFTGTVLKSLLESPNNLLGVEYLKALDKLCALRRLSLPIVPLTVRRKGSTHDGPRSAMELRREMRAGGEGIDDGIMEIAAVSRLRALDREVFRCAADAENGAGDRIYEAVQSGACTLDEICQRAKTKSIAYSRLRRVTMRVLLGIPKEMTANGCLPPYARILAANERGRRYLADNRKKQDNWKITEPEGRGNISMEPAGRISIPVVIRGKEIKKMNREAQEIFYKGVIAKDFCNLGFPGRRALPCGEDWRLTPFLG